MEVQGEQDFTEETDDTKSRKNMRKNESGEDFWRLNQWECITRECWWNAKGSRADLGEKEHEGIFLDKLSKEFRN